MKIIKKSIITFSMIISLFFGSAQAEVNEDRFAMRFHMQGVQKTCKPSTEIYYSKENNDKTQWTYKGTSYNRGVTWKGESIGSTYGFNSIKRIENSDEVIYSPTKERYDYSGSIGYTSYVAYYGVIRTVVNNQKPNPYCK